MKSKENTKIIPCSAEGYEVFYSNILIGTIQRQYNYGNIKWLFSSPNGGHGETKYRWQAINSLVELFKKRNH